MTIRRWIHDKLDRFEIWSQRRDEMSVIYNSCCQICKKNMATTRCYEGCNKFICDDCESHFYEDATICVECEVALTPEKRAEMMKERANALAEECICFMTPGVKNPACELDDEEHEFIKAHADAEESR